MLSILQTVQPCFKLNLFFVLAKISQLKQKSLLLSIKSEMYIENVVFSLCLLRFKEHLRHEYLLLNNEPDILLTYRLAYLLPSALFIIFNVILKSMFLRFRSQTYFESSVSFLNTPPLKDFIWIAYPNWFEFSRRRTSSRCQS